MARSATGPGSESGLIRAARQRDPVLPERVLAHRRALGKRLAASMVAMGADRRRRRVPDRVLHRPSDETGDGRGHHHDTAVPTVSPVNAPTMVITERQNGATVVVGTGWVCSCSSPVP